MFWGKPPLFRAQHNENWIENWIKLDITSILCEWIKKKKMLLDYFLCWGIAFR